ncbi:uncharacterized protein C19orf47 homolog isoform X5 [Hyla sarda]|uniref:uncharacterized protein C19orf47 homolog isoform X5 n=1 Tax=Hyla sarda TaxID=327740 RepID=UPI0024C43AA3|nr:uncharacterized protein C19orf47 homolog isoform X5 [Hyla sarda]
MPGSAAYLAAIICEAPIMVSVTMATSEWINFFKEAGIPAGPAVNYAVTFVDNRIQKSMLMDLNKEIINELGITAVGDVIAILKHAKVVHRQDICKAMTEAPSQTIMQSELRRNANSRESPLYLPALSSPLDDTAAAEGSVKRRRVTAEMEGKYIINMPKGTTARTKKILEEQAAKGTIRTSVFDRLGAESKADTTTGAKPTGVFSRLGDAHEAGKSADSDEDSSVLQYAGVLKRKNTPVSREKLTPGITIKAKATSSEQKAPITTTIKRLATKPPASAPAKLTTSKITLAQRLGTVPQVVVEEERKRKKPSAAMVQRLGKQQVVAQDSKVSSSKAPVVAFKPTFTIKRTVGNARVTSSSDNSSAQMDISGNISVFKRLGRKSV